MICYNNLNNFRGVEKNMLSKYLPIVVTLVISLAAVYWVYSKQKQILTKCESIESSVSSQISTITSDMVQIKYNVNEIARIVVSSPQQYALHPAHAHHYPPPPPLSHQTQPAHAMNVPLPSHIQPQVSPMPSIQVVEDAKELDELLKEELQELNVPSPLPSPKKKSKKNKKPKPQSEQPKPQHESTPPPPPPQQHDEIVPVQKQSPPPVPIASPIAAMFPSTTAGIAVVIEEISFQAPTATTTANDDLPIIEEITSDDETPN